MIVSVYIVYKANRIELLEGIQEEAQKTVYISINTERSIRSIEKYIF